MAINVTCSTCLHVYDLPDSKAGLKVRCRKCEGSIKVPGTPVSDEDAEDVEEAGIAEAASASARKERLQEDREAIQSSPRSRRTRETREEEDEKPARARKKRFDPEDEEEPAVKKSPAGGGVSPLVFVLGGIALVLFLACGGIGAVVYLVYSSTSRAVNGLVAEVQEAGQQARRQNEPFQPVDPVVGNQPEPFPVFNPPPRPEFVDRVGPPRDLDEAVAWLRDPTDNRPQRALSFINGARVDEARKPQVARALEELLTNHHLRDQALTALKSWATADNVPALNRLVTDEVFLVDPVYDVLGNLKDERSIEPLIDALPNHFKGNAAERALRNFGKKAEKAVLKQLNHRDPRVRNRVDALLRSYGTTAEVRFEQTVSDLENGDNEMKGRLMKQLPRKADPAFQVRVSKALDPFLLDGNPFVKGDALQVLRVWATAENVLSLIRLLDDPFLKGDAMDILGTLKDERAAAALATKLDTNDRQRAGLALVKIGTPAEKEVIPYTDPVAVRSPQTRALAIQVLGKIGTKELSVPALKKVSAVSERLVALECQQAIKEIQARGK